MSFHVRGCWIWLAAGSRVQSFWFRAGLGQKRVDCSGSNIRAMMLSETLHAPCWHFTDLQSAAVLRTVVIVFVQVASGGRHHNSSAVVEVAEVGSSSKQQKQ